MEEREILALYNEVKNIENEKAIYVRAIQRLSIWEDSINSKKPVQNNISKEKTDEMIPKWQALSPAVMHLYNCIIEIESDDIANKLIEFNGMLDTFYGLETKIVKELYHFLRIDPYSLISALAIFDARISICEECNNNEETKIIDLIPVFRFLCEGLNIMGLRRRWTHIYTSHKDKDAFENFKTEYLRKGGKRESFAKEIMNDFYLHNTFPKNDFKISVYNRNIASLLYEGMYEPSIHNYLYLQITCPTIPECYRALCWAESLGDLQSRFVRNNSLWHPSPTGMTRLQTSIKKDGHIIIFRIGTKESIQHNEWGIILNIIEGKYRSPNLTRSASSINHPILVYDITGKPFEVEAGSYITDYISEFYTVEEMQFFREAFVNGRSVNLDYQLKNDDIIRIIADPQHRNENLINTIKNGNQSPITDKNIKVLLDVNNTASELGRRRLLDLLEPFLEKWALKVTDIDIKLVLLLRGHKTIEKQEEFLRNLYTDRSKDNELRWQFLKFLLRGKIVDQFGKPLDIHWNDIRIAQDCAPNFNDEIVGTKVFGPKDKTDPRYGSQPKMIHVHKKDCPNGPEPQNKIELLWKKDTPRYLNFGVQFIITIRDDYGSLGNLLEVFYTNTLLNIHYLAADAVNFGNKNAKVTVLATGSTEFDIQAAITEIEMQFPNHVKYRKLQGRDARILGRKVDTCPYILTGDSEIHSEVPLLFISRTDELSTLIQSTANMTMPSIMIIGYFRIGKTWLLKKFREQYQQSGDYCIYLTFEICPDNPLDPSAVPHLFYDQVIRQLVKYNLMFNNQRPKSLSALSIWIEETCKMNNCKLIFLIDEFSAVAEWTNEKFLIEDFPEHFDRFMKDTPRAYFILIFQASQIYGISDSEKETSNDKFVDYFRNHIGDKIELKPFNQHEVHELLTDPIKGKYTLDEKIPMLAYTLTGGNPFLTQQIGKNIWNYMMSTEKKHISFSEFQSMFNEIYLANNDWQSYLRRILHQLPNEYKALLVYISQIQTPQNNKPWYNFEEIWCNEDIIITKMQEGINLSESATVEMIERLINVNLLIRNENSRVKSYQIKSKILSYYLSMNGEQGLSRRKNYGRE